MGAVQKLATFVAFGLAALGALLVVYTADEPNRRDAEEEEQQHVAVERGIQTYLTYCLTCHGPRGEGFLSEQQGYIGWPLAGDEVTEADPNLEKYQDGLTPTQRNQTDDEILWEEREEIISDALHNGRNVIMPLWGAENGGELNNEQINELIEMIHTVDWDHVYEEAVAANGGQPPAPPAPALNQSQDDTGPAEDDSMGTGDQGTGAPAARLAARDIAWDTNQLTLPVGGTLALVNEGAAQHNFAVEGFNDAAPVDMPIGGEQVLWTVPPELAPGQYVYYCAVPGHRPLMQGTLTITEAAAAPAGAPADASPAGASPAAAPAAPAAGGAAPVALEALDIAWSTNTLTVPVGGTVNLVNAGAAQHNFAIEGYNDDAPVDMPIGGAPVAWTVPADLPPGQYVYYCAVPGHKALMTGTLTIQ